MLFSGITKKRSLVNLYLIVKLNLPYICWRFGHFARRKELSLRTWCGREFTEIADEMGNHRP